MQSKKKSFRKPKSAGNDKIIQAYRQAMLQEGKQPPSVFAFCQSIGIAEDEFYKQYGSFEAIDKAIWKAYLQKVGGRLKDDTNYPSFSVREKILAFYFTLAEVLRADRSFVLYGLKDCKNPATLPAFLKAFKTDFEAWINPVLNEGKQSGEIAQRPILDTRYASLFWLHLVFVLQFWAKDDSPGFEQTDVAIEKSVNLAFDLVGKGILDNALDFGKFMYQSAKA